MRNLIAILALAWTVSPALAQSITDPGFEVPTQGAGKFAYRPAGSSWTFTGGAGVAGNYSGFTASNPAAPQGNQVAFLQGTCAISQTVTGWAGGSFYLVFQAAQRNYPTPGGARQDLSVSVDGQTVATIRPAGTAYATYYAALPALPAGDHIVSIAGLNTVTGDNTALVDAVSIVAASSIATPASVADAWVGSSGKTIGFRFSSGGSAALPTQTVVAPTIYRNGQALAPLGSPADLGANEALLFPLPTGVAIAGSDIITASTAPLWQATTGGMVAPLAGVTIDNRVGRSPLPPSLLAPKTLMPGVNNNNSPCAPWGNYWPLKNWAYKLTAYVADTGKIRGNTIVRVYSNPSYPGPSGLWLIYWKSSVGPKGEPAAYFGMRTIDSASTTVTERTDLANTNAPNGYKARVFSFDHAPGSVSPNIDVAVQTGDPSATGNYDDLWVVGPGDFDYVDGQPVTFDTSDKFAVSRTYQQWLGPGVGSLRWCDSSNCGGSPVSCPYPELLLKSSDYGWGELGFRRVRFGYTSIGPVDVKTTPWMYSPFYRKDNERFTATLTQDITTTPAVGTNETYTFSDADTAPLMAGLEITIDSEVMRLIRVAGQAVTVYRGSNGTKPATHAAGAVSVSGRRPIGLNTDGLKVGGDTVYQLTTREPHGQFTGSLSVNTQGDGWPQVTWSDGRTTGVPGTRLPYVTGPNTLVGLFPGPAVKPSQTYALDPSRCYSETAYGSYIPPEVTAMITARFPKAAIHVNVNLDACDDLVWHQMRLIRDHFPAGRTVIVEYMNEPWNYGFGTPEFCQRAGVALGYEYPYQLSWYLRRSCEVGAIARAAFAEKGRGDEIKLMLNCQMGSDQPKSHLTYAAKNGWKVDRIGNAPYLQIDVGQGAFATWDDDQLCDLWPVFLWFDRRISGYAVNAWLPSTKSAISDYNKAVGNDGCQLMGYEGGIELAVPNGSKDQATRTIDLIYNPNWYFFEHAFYEWCQKQGFVNFHVYSLSQYNNTPTAWGMAHWPRQRLGYGDGRFGGTDNRLRLARPGQLNTKPANVSVDLNDSVRLQAFRDWTR